MWVRFMGWEDPLEEENVNATPVFLPEKSHGERTLVGYCPKGCKESDMTEQLSTAFKGKYCEQTYITKWLRPNMDYLMSRKPCWVLFSRVLLPICLQ